MDIFKQSANVQIFKLGMGGTYGKFYIPNLRGVLQICVVFNKKARWQEEAMSSFFSTCSWVLTKMWGGGRKALAILYESLRGC